MLHPGAPLGTKLLLELTAQARRERRTAPAGRDRDLQRAPMRDRGIDKVTMPRIINGVAQNAARGASAIDGGIGAARTGGGDNEKRAIKIFRGKGALTPDDYTGAYLALDGKDCPWTDNGDIRSAEQEPLDFCRGYFSGPDNDAVLSCKVEQDREVDGSAVHASAFEAMLQRIA